MFKKLHVMMSLQVVLVVCAFAIQSGCARTGAAEKTYPAGATAEVGDFAYTVSGELWLTSLDGERGPRIPSSKFLVLTLSVTSKKSDRSTIPLVTLLDGEGKTYLELDNGEGLPNWLGLIRNIEPNASEGGTIVFDVPSGKGPYKARVSSGGDIEKEVTALIEVPDEKATHSGAAIPGEGQ